VTAVVEDHAGEQSAAGDPGLPTLCQISREPGLVPTWVGPHADEVINLFSIAIRHDLTADDLKGTMFAYPTGASDIGYML
jgi:pyruvate/2-oxoglutarate dehydrogenase complex dihydrolipoamide dehydrogenase (E3) component